jgi:hypothetical protein
MRRRLLAVLALLAGWLVGLALYRRTAASRRERVDLYFEDGSMLSVGDGTPEADRLLPLAREALGAARSG